MLSNTLFFFFQALHVDFVEFLQHFDSQSVNLCGDNGVTMTFGVLNFADTHRLKLGYIWDEFSSSQQFKRGGIIRFKFELINETTVSRQCHVYKPYWGICFKEASRLSWSFNVIVMQCLFMFFNVFCLQCLFMCFLICFCWTIVAIVITKWLLYVCNLLWIV
jgi:hypothetical protein